MTAVDERPAQAPADEPADLLEVMLLRIRKDPELAVDLAYCVPLGIPHSEFAGAERWPGQPRWTDQDRLKVMAWREHVARRDEDLCRDCHTHRREWDPRLGGDVNAYEPQPIQCRGCELTESLLKELSNRPEFQAMHGLKARLVPLEQVLADLRREQDQAASRG